MWKYVLASLTVLICLISCDNRTDYHSYKHTPVAGWSNNDTVAFEIPRSKNNGSHRLFLGLRTSTAYPFMAIRIVVVQRIIPGNMTIKDTIDCDLTDAKGKTKGNGVGYRQYEFPITELQLRKGDSISVRVYHDMRREVVPGISDIGLRVEDCLGIKTL